MTEKKLKGFALLNPEQRKAIASAGGKAGHAQGKAHKWTTEEARAAGKLSHSRTSDPEKARAAQKLAVQSRAAKKAR